MNSQKKFRKEVIRQALLDPGFHRAKFHKKPLDWPQVDAINLVEKHVAERSGKILTIRSSRQTMKNEVSATIEARALLRYKNIGGSVVKSAPTYKPQIVNSKRRLDQMIRLDPLMNGVPKGYKEGYIKQYNAASIEFLSADKGANVEGATASLLLEIDEAHLTDANKFEESFAPMTAYTAAPTVMYGVAAAKADLLYQQRIFNESYDKSLNLQFPAELWCELRPAYAKHFEERVKKLGYDHPIICTQYRLIDIDSLGGFFTRYQILNMLSGDHSRRLTRNSEKYIAATIDIAGEAEDGEDVGPDRAQSKRDQTVCLIWEVDYSKERYGIPLFRLLDIYFWVGKPLSEGPSGLPGQQETLLGILRKWQVTKTVVDARGVGEQIAAYLASRFSNVEQYKATDITVSEDCYSLLGFLNNDQVKVFKDDHSPEYQELVRQINHAGREIKNHDKLKMIKPNNDPTRHIDMAKAMTYLQRTLESYVISF